MECFKKSKLVNAFNLPALHFSSRIIRSHLFLIQNCPTHKKAMHEITSVPDTLHDQQILAREKWLPWELFTVHHVLHEGHVSGLHLPPTSNKMVASLIAAVFSFKLGCPVWSVFISLKLRFSWSQTSLEPTENFAMKKPIVSREDDGSNLWTNSSSPGLNHSLMLQAPQTVYSWETK